MRLDFMREKNKNFPECDLPDSILNLRVWHCKFKSLAEISTFKNLEELVIGTLPDDSLSFISGLTNLRYLRILHMPKIRDLSPIKALQKLENLSLETAVRAKPKFQEVESFSSISNLGSLKHIELHSIGQPDHSLAAC